MQFRAMRHHAFYAQLPHRARYNLSDACGATATLNDLLSEEEFARLAAVPLIYGTAPGREDLRDAIYQLYKPQYPDLGPDHITVLSGTEEGLFSIMACLLNPGDEVIGLLPCYPSLSDLPACFGAVFKAVHLLERNQWQPEVAEFAALITPHTKAIVINSPHNPTGMTLSQAWLDDLLALCEKHGLYLIADDVFAFSEFASIPCRRNILQYDKAILANVLSKTFGLAGLRIGWVMTRNLALTTAIRNLKTYNSICQSQLDEQVACFVLQKADVIISRNNAIVRANVEAFDAFVARHEFLRWLRPSAGIVGLVHSDEPIEQLLKQWFARDVMALPGELFGIQGDYFRVGFGKADFAEALACID